ncbi:hypothetical protein CANARDRAFT_30200 [[Candida] arabinofermentans NRRL YB-2248]|uniref:Uncharacterized protein n=1 Tax=[Candida] arabinofermentans NRRL YB-2248 TaxID=983967 RepID=A0A1E4SUS6_9ASCO|nr:hypothetical protein CANARDRAFT_30200 [[Candida] arabinofermentans NRRL YB-2248]
MTKSPIWHLPLQKGGLGLLDLHKQLLDRRASYLYELISPKSPRYMIYHLLASHIQETVNVFVQSNLYKNSLLLPLWQDVKSVRNKYSLQPADIIDLSKSPLGSASDMTLWCPYFLTFLPQTRICY